MSRTELVNEAERISDIFARIMHKVMTSESHSDSDEVSIAQSHALRFIEHHGSCTIGDLAEGLSISQPASTTIVDRMVKRGLVERRPGERDRRQSEVLLTDHARSLLRRIEHERTQRLSDILALMPPQERRQFVESLENFVAAALRLEQIADDACLRCGVNHDPSCIVNQAHIELAGKNIERT